MDVKNYMNFSKYHSLGNNFVFVDNRQKTIDLSDPALITKLCNVKFGIGADCLVEILTCENPDHSNCRYQLVVHCSNGTICNLCANGSRCSVKFCVQLGMASADEDITFCTDGREYTGRLHASTGLVHLLLKYVDGSREEINDSSFRIFTGSDIFVNYVDNINEVDVQKEGDEACAMYDKRYPEFISMFVQKSQTGRGILVRSYESGVCGETWACGSGTVGSALVELSRKTFTDPTSVFMDVHVRIGTLTVTAKRVGPTLFSDVYLIGPAVHVYDGVINLRDNFSHPLTGHTFL